MNHESYEPVNPGDIVWIESNGGPLLLLSQELLSDWEGIKGPIDHRNRNIHIRFRWGAPDAPATDYDRASDVEDYLGQLQVGSGCALVLGGEPMSTCWLPGKTGLSGILLRWQYGENEVSVVSWISKIPDYIWQLEPFDLHVGAQPLYLFDAAYPGSQIDQFLEVRLPKGSYDVTTAIYQPDEYTSLVLHRFTLS